MPELRSLIGVLEIVRRRALVKKLLGELAGWSCGILAWLLLSAALSPNLYWACVAAGICAAAALGVSLFRSVKSRPTLYEAALQLDRAAGLKDRLSTAIFFSGQNRPDVLIRRQREDALAHLASVDARSLFPIRVPARSVWALVLTVLAGAMFAYRLSSGPPLLGLLQRTARIRLVKEILSPIVHAMERDRRVRAEQRTAPQPQDSNKQAAKNAGGRQPGDEPGGAQDGRSREGTQQGRHSAESGSSSAQQEQREANQPAGQNGNGGGEQQQQGEQREGEQQPGGGAGSQADNGRQQQQQTPGGGQSGQQPGQSEPNGAPGRNQSLAQTILQALKNMFSQAPSGQATPSQGQLAQNQSPGQPQGQPQAGTNPNRAPQPDGANSPTSAMQAPQPGQGQQQEGNKAGNGIGQQPGSAQGKQSELLAVRTRPDEVPLPSQSFTGQAEVRARIGQGSVQAPARGAAPVSPASPAGAEQENVPLRYRLYVQRYFDHRAKEHK